jgi:hypothetical protein
LKFGVVAAAVVPQVRTIRLASLAELQVLIPWLLLVELVAAAVGIAKELVALAVLRQVVHTITTVHQA